MPREAGFWGVTPAAPSRRRFARARVIDTRLSPISPFAPLCVELQGEQLREMHVVTPDTKDLKST